MKIALVLATGRHLYVMPGSPTRVRVTNVGAGLVPKPIGWVTSVRYSPASSSSLGVGV